MRGTKWVWRGSQWLLHPSLPFFLTALAKPQGEPPLFLCPMVLWSRREEGKDMPVTNPRGVWLELPHPASQTGHSGLIPTSPKFPWRAAGEPKPPRCLQSHQLHFPPRPFNAAELLEVLGNTFSKGFGWSLEDMESTGGKQAQAGRDDTGDQTATQ